MHIFQASTPQDIKLIMQDIKVDDYGIRIMAPKATSCLIRINSLSNIAANIIKQEMLSLGGDVAVSRDALTGRSRQTDCLVIATMAQLTLLKEKLIQQPFGLGKLAGELSRAIENYRKDEFTLKAGKFTLHLGSRSHIMGIMNLTTDSFSGDGLFRSRSLVRPLTGRPDQYSKDVLLGIARRLVDEGADILDIGGESSRPGSRPVPVKEEIKRVIPVIRLLAKNVKVPLSVDTYKPEVAEQAADNGAVIINDITGMRGPRMARVAARYGCAVVVMHMRGMPVSMQKNIAYDSLMGEIISYLDTAVSSAVEAGISRDRIIIDPGLGFGKTAEHNIEILKRLKELKSIGCPILVGPSRKAFLGKILKKGPQDRVIGTVAACSQAVLNGAHIVRVHDVSPVKQALKVIDSIHRQ